MNCYYKWLKIFKIYKVYDDVYLDFLHLNFNYYKLKQEFWCRSSIIRLEICNIFMQNLLFAQETVLIFWLDLYNIISFFISWTVNRRRPVSNTRPLVLTKTTLVLIHDNGSAQKTGALLIKGKSGHLFRTSKRFFDTGVRFFASLKQSAACL